jgi:hypothetical protein
MRLLLPVALALAGAVRGAELRSPTLSLRIRDGAVVELKNRLSGESFVVEPERVSLPAGLHRLGEPLLQVRSAIETAARERATQSAGWSNGARFELRAEIEPATGDVLISQTGESSQKKLAGISWALADLPDHFEVLVPGCSGQRFSADSPMGRREFDYPILWEASFVLIQGRKGGFLIRADEDPPRFKNLTVEHTRKSFRLRFESRNLAPFADKSRIESSRWRITPYRGSWQTGAAIYRKWAEAHHPLTPLAQQQPAWVHDTQFVVTMQLNPSLLPDLARHCTPTQTLLYIPGWRRDGYDRNYPDYTAVTNFDSFITEAHRLGFRVMAHVNYFGCHPENPVYEQVKQAHLRDPFTGELLWWEWPANPPIKFAYINPASRAWRELFVERMKELVQHHKVDALHLDQTLCIYNDANGLVDGMTCMEGSLALHRELRAALPDVALSGEGLNEISGQYEAFAQRHVWSMDHMNRTWDDRVIAMSHPISSAVLAPYTHIYGYLGMPNPTQGSFFTVWQRAYEPLGVIPTYNWPDAAQLANPPPGVAEVLTLARFFQQHQPAPDFDSPWEKNDVFVYRLADGGRAFYRKDDNGVLFGRGREGRARHSVRAAELYGDHGAHGMTRPTKVSEPIEVLSRRIEGVTVAKVNGSIPGWPAYNAKRLLGLDPNQSYSWSARPRDLRAPRISALPEGVVLEQAGIHADFARFRLRNLAGSSQIPLWDFRGEVKTGVLFADGTTRDGDALDFTDDDSGGMVHPEHEGFFLHPPWRGGLSTKGRPITFVEFPLRLPKAGRVQFTSGVHLREAAIGKSDGVTFRVLALRGDRKLSAEIHHDGAEPKPLRLDLTEFAGEKVRLRLEVDAGPKNNSSFDWALITKPRVVGESSASPVARTIHFAGLKTVRAAFAGTNHLSLQTNADGRAKIKTPLPGPLILAFAEPTPVSASCDLLETKFTCQFVFEDGIELPASGAFGAAVTNAACAEENRRGLSLQPPMKGRSLADWLVRLPDTPLRLVTAIGLRDGATGKSLRCEVQVNGETIFARSLNPGAGWLPLELDLSAWRGQAVLLTFATEAERYARSSQARWAEPRLQ